MTTNRKRHLKSEFDCFKRPSILFKFIWFVKCWRNYLGLNSKGPHLSLGKKKKKTLFFVLFTQCIKRAREVRKFHVSVLQGRLRNAQKKRDARAKLLFCHSKPIVFLPFSLLSPSSLLKLPIVVNQKFCYHDNVTAHFSSLLDRAKTQAYSNDVCDHVLMTPLLLKERELRGRMFYWPSKTRK